MTKVPHVDPGSLTAEVAKTPRPRPLRGAISALIAAVIAVTVAAYENNWFTAAPVGSTDLRAAHAIEAGGAVLFAIFAMVAVTSFARIARWYLETAIGADYASMSRYAIILIGTLLVGLAAFSLAGIFVWQLVLPGAITAVLITIAAQQALANLFAGVMLQFTRPFAVGERVQIRSGGLAGTIEGTVVELSLGYVRLATDAGLVFVPNAQVLAAAVGPVPAPSPDLPLTPDIEDSDQPQRLGEPDDAESDGAAPDGAGAPKYGRGKAAGSSRAGG